MMEIRALGLDRKILEERDLTVTDEAEKKIAKLEKEWKTELRWLREQLKNLKKHNV
ncbi:hypothetical protein NDK43_06790 [Neobacillus pocheonensis]|uniref:Uncharacterized protein n=1 Tax=Neobacillus pocheonensis TaxID=363869 RepID=A0ABT0W756_9BACI|nr:hypothetical protein [Neobacillus pocheonensis]